MTLKAKVHALLEPSDGTNKGSRNFDIFIITLILLNVIAVVLETVEPISAKLQRLFNLFELISVIIFTIEYVLRLWSCTEHTRHSRPALGRIKYMFTPYAIIDLLAILPFYLQMFFVIDARFLRTLRLLRLFRLLKLGRYTNSIEVFQKIVKEKSTDLLVALTVLTMLLVVSSSLMYYAERGAQPEVFSSIPATMWWGVATLSTVGYGDIYPITTIGKLLGTVIAFLGIAVFALPAGILSSGFVDEMAQKKNKELTKCPHCHKDLD